jgi:YD repeat-containing protein
MVSSHTNGASVDYTYDTLNRLSTVVDNRLSGSNTTTYAYDSASNVATVTYPNGVESTFTYDDLNRVSDVSSGVSGYSYLRGPTGNLTNALESSGRAETWTYDGIYRLTDEAISSDPAGKNGSAGYSPDPVGNRLSVSSTISSLGGWPGPQE